VGSCRKSTVRKNVTGTFRKRPERGLSDLKCCQGIDLEPGRLQGLSRVVMVVVYLVLARVVARRSFYIVAGVAGGLSKCCAI